MKILLSSAVFLLTTSPLAAKLVAEIDNSKRGFNCYHRGINNYSTLSKGDGVIKIFLSEGGKFLVYFNDERYALMACESFATYSRESE